MLRYWAATALFEEVQMLNRYVQDANVAGAAVSAVDAGTWHVDALAQD